MMRANSYGNADHEGGTMKAVCKFSGLIGVASFGAIALVSLVFFADSSRAETPLDSLKTVSIPEPPNLAEFVVNETAAIQLGKALFWDVQVGSDGKTACASCHFHAGADNRAKNQLSPALLGGDETFQLGGPNYTLTATDFPFTRFTDPNNRDSAILSDTNDIVSSMGVFNRLFTSVTRGVVIDVCSPVVDPVFHVNGINTRGVEPRNSLSVINAGFNFRQFWDGRARENFNGVNAAGQTDTTARVYRATTTAEIPVAIDLNSSSNPQYKLEFSSLASQAVEPPLSGLEMSCAGRIWPRIGQKLLTLVPLGQQHVDPTDSVLGTIAIAGASSKGLSASYQTLIRTAFRPEWWQSKKKVTINGIKFSQAQANFSLFFGLAVQLYEATLVADDTPFDRFKDGTGTLTDAQQRGLNVFEGQAGCNSCHDGPELTFASINEALATERDEQGFENVGVRPIEDDPGLTSDAQVPFAAARMKTPGLRNVELTGPYFRNGGKGTLRQVVQLYNRGGDFATTGLRPLNLTDQEQDDLVEFMLALTDERVRIRSGPFDHPELCIPNGHVGNATAATDADGDGQADDETLCIAAVGAAGDAANPLQPFLGLDPFLAD